MVIDPSLARGLTSRDLSRWAEVAERNWHDLEEIGQQALDLLDAGRPPAKVVNRVLKEMRLFFQRPDVLGKVFSFSARRHGYCFLLPKLYEDGLRFSLVLGSLDGRRRITPGDVFKMASASRHALERLHQRLGTMEAGEVLTEVYSALGAAQKLRQAADAIKAPQFPLLGQRGLFVAAPGEAVACSLITWIRYEQLGARWQGVVDDLRKVPGLSDPFIFNSDQCAAALRRHSWLMEPHQPGVDVEAMWWSQPRD